MFKLVETRPYKDGRGHRFTFQTERDLFLRGDEGHLVFVPKGKPERPPSSTTRPSSLSTGGSP